MKKLILTVILAASFTGCGDSIYTSVQAPEQFNSNGDPITPFVEPNSQDNLVYTEDHCADINVGERVFYGDLKSMRDINGLASMLEDNGICTTQENGFQNYNGLFQYEVNEGTNRCSFWNRHGMQVYVNFVKGYSNSAVVTIDATGDGWPQGGGQGFPTARMQYRNAKIDCSKKDMTITVNQDGNVLQITAPKESGNKYSSYFRGSVSYNGSLLSSGLFYITQ